MKRILCSLILLTLATSAAWAADPAVKSKVETIWKAPELPRSISMGSDLALNLPAVPAREGYLRVLRIQARMDLPPNSGWSALLELEINGRKVNRTAGDLRNSPPRVLNRDLLWKPSGMESEEIVMRDTLLNMVFAPDFKQYDQRLKHEGEEAFWFVLNVSDLLSADHANVVKLNNIAQPAWYEGKNLPIVLGDVSVGYLPVSYQAAVQKALARPLPAGKSVSVEGCQVVLTPGGGMAVQVGKEYYVLETSFTWPDGALNWLACPDRSLGATPPEWHIVKADLNSEGGQVVAEGKFYRLTRDLTFDGPRVQVADKIDNLTPNDLGIEVSYDLSAGADVVYLGGDPVATYQDIVSCNPTLFVGQTKSGLGWLAEDDLLRAQLRMRQSGGHTVMYTNNLGLAPKASTIFEWTLYPRQSADYWDFINQVRRDWNVNFTIEGPFLFFGQASSVSQESVESIRARIKDQHVKLATLHPWTNYQYPYDREKHKAWWKVAEAKIRQVDPTIKCLLMMEPPLESRVHMDKVEQDPYCDSVALNPDGKPAYDLEYSPAYVTKGDFAAGYRLVWRYPMISPEDAGKTDLTPSPLAAQHPSVADIVAGGFNFKPAPVVTNTWMKYLDYDVDFAMKECGADGMYIDCFSYGFSRSWARFTYDRWDGHTVDLDPRTHKITRKYADLSLLSAPGQERIIRRIQAAGGTIVANTEPGTKNMRAVRLNRFVETGGGAHDDYSTHLYTPIALGMPMGSMPQNQRNAKGFIADVVLNLKHGALYYYYTIPLGFDYGCINRMFPFTPRELHAGWLVGEERIITSVPGEFGWADMSKARVYHYNLEGKETKPAAQPETVDKANVWRIQLQPGEIVILEREKQPAG
jgi:hypothetical protein